MERYVLEISICVIVIHEIPSFFGRLGHIHALLVYILECIKLLFRLPHVILVQNGAFDLNCFHVYLSIDADWVIYSFSGDLRFIFIL